MALTAQDILDYDDAQRDLAKAKKVEIEKRNKIINHFRYNGAVEGVQHKSVEGLEVDILITLGLTRSIDNDALDALWADLDPEQKSAIVQKPSLVMKKYKELVDSDDAGELLNIVTEKPRQATIKLKYED